MPLLPSRLLEQQQENLQPLPPQNTKIVAALLDDTSSLNNSKKCVLLLLLHHKNRNTKSLPSYPLPGGQNQTNNHLYFSSLLFDLFSSSVRFSSPLVFSCLLLASPLLLSTLLFHRMKQNCNRMQPTTYQVSPPHEDYPIHLAR
jgi:type II secretory pathway predicted ATPase ExeA